MGELESCCSSNYGDETYGYVPVKDSYLRRLKRIEGQVRGIERMVQDEKYCIDVLTQVAAATGALQSLALAMLDDHISHCVVKAARVGGEEAEIKLAEISDAIGRMVRR